VKSQSLPPRVNIRRAAQQVSIRTDPILEGPFTQGLADLDALAIPQGEHPPYVAAGVPWFLTLFGRDSLVPALMAGLDGMWSAKAALSALSSLQATERDDWRWTGDEQLLGAHLETAKAALHWCEERGDRDGDGLLEYATRSSRGYRAISSRHIWQWPSC
jgi:glycogen debranching enzyme